MNKTPRHQRGRVPQLLPVHAQDGLMPQDTASMRASSNRNSSIQLTATAVRTIAQIEQQASDIKFPPAVKNQLRQVAMESKTAQEAVIASVTNEKPHTYVIAAQKFISETSQSTARSEQHQTARPYRRCIDWTKRDEDNASKLAASGCFGITEIAKMVNRSVDAVRRKLRRCGFTGNSPCRGDDSFSQRQLAEKVRVHRRVIREWETLGLASRPKREYAMHNGVLRTMRYGFIPLEALKNFFGTSVGVDAASRLDGVSLECLRELIGYNPVQRDQRRVHKTMKQVSQCKGREP
jgi:hypothetical protein